MKEFYPREVEPDFCIITHVNTFISPLTQLGRYTDPSLILSKFLTSYLAWPSSHR